MPDLTLADLDRIEALANQEPRMDALQEVWTALPALLRLARLGAEKEAETPAGMAVTDCRRCRNEDGLHDGRLLCADETPAVLGWVREAAWSRDYSVARAPTLCPGFKGKETA